MINITITYPRLLRKQLKVLRLTHPSKWTDVTSPQMEMIGRLMAGDVKEIDVIKTFLGTSPRIVKKLDAFHNYKLGELLNFISEQEPLSYFIIDGFDGYMAPMPKLADITFAEFIVMDTFYIDYNSDPENIGLLDNFLAVLFVQHTENKRPRFTNEYDAGFAKTLKGWQIQTALTNYGLVRIWLQDAFPEVFGKKTDDNTDTKQKKQSNGWLDVFDSIVGDDLVHSDDYANKPVTEVLRWLNKKIIDNRKQKAKNK